MESMAIDISLLCLAAAGMIIALVKNRRLDSLAAPSSRLWEKDKGEE
jgi:hypothetical protein